jgi:phosphatidylserine/phosphatidylglycerophosphate/cardiolipin synthase-like enzyme
MLRKSSIFFALVLIFSSFSLGEEPSIEVYFSPRGGCIAAIVKHCLDAKTSIKVQAYGFSSPVIADALINAKKRGVAVSLILDRSNNTSKYSQAKHVSQSDIAVWIDSKHSIAHNKVMIIDDDQVITGSFNFSDNAENSNAENLVIICDKPTAKKYTDNWDAHLQHSAVYGK